VTTIAEIGLTGGVFTAVALGVVGVIVFTIVHRARSNDRK